MARTPIADPFAMFTNAFDKKIQVKPLPSIGCYLQQLNSTNEVATVRQLGDKGQKAKSSTLSIHSGEKRKLVSILPKPSTNKTTNPKWIDNTLEVKWPINYERRMWSREEDEYLRNIVKKYHGKNWSNIASQMYNRSAKQCCRRWHMQLKDDIVKTVWTALEDQILLKNHSNMGNKWTDLSKLLPGRTPTAVQNRFRSLRLQQRQ